MTEKQKRQNLPYALPVDGLVIRYHPEKLQFGLWHHNELVGYYDVRTQAVAMADAARKEGIR